MKPVLLFPVLVLSAFLLTGPAARSQEESTNALDSISLSEIAPCLVLIEYELNGETKRASGVIVQMGEKSYILTNQHTLLGAERLRFMTDSGKRLSPVKVELSSNRDLVRLALKDAPKGLNCSSAVKMNMPVALCAAVEGEGRKTEKGKIIGVGGIRFEISGSIGEESFGAPILDTNRQVVGIASYNRESMKSAMKIGTRFEDATRNFCYRISPKGWKAVNWRSYNRRFGKAYQEHKAFADEVIQTLKNREENHISSSRASELSSACRTHARQIELLTEQRDISGFLRSEFIELTEIFEFADKWFSTYAKSLN